MTTNDIKWLFRLVFFLLNKNEPTKHPKENPFNLEENLKDDLEARELSDSWLALGK